MAASVHADRRGSGPRLVLVHGFTQNRNCWGRIADDLARDHELVLVDAPGHGRSADLALDLAGGAAAIGVTGGAGSYLGYSLGGRYCLRLALDRPELVERLVLVGATPGIEVDRDRDERRRADGALADLLEQIGVTSFLDEWLAQPLFAGLSPAAACRRERVENTAAGLASSLRRAGTGMQEPLWDRLGALSMPVLVVTGDADTKFTAIADAMVAAIGPGATQIVVPGAGHTAHLERPDAFLSALRAWLRSTATA